MAAKAKLTVFALAVVFPLLVVCINLKAFWITTSLLMAYFSIKSLRELIIVNFASDSYYESYMQKRSESVSVSFILTDAVLVCGAYSLIMVMLFMSLFLLTNPVMKIYSLILLGFWAFDFRKVFTKPSEDEEWSYKDQIKEIVMWVQGIASVLFTIISLIVL